MPMSPEQRLEVLKKARAAKAAKAVAKAEGSVEPNAPKTEEPKPKPKRAPKAKKEEVKTLDLTEDKHQVPDAEINLLLEPSQQEKEEIKQINNRGNPKPKPILEPDPEPEVEVIEEIVKKPKKKKIIRRIIEEASSDEDDVEIVYEKAPPKPKAKAKAPKQQAVPPREVPAPRNPFFCY